MSRALLLVAACLAAVDAFVPARLSSGPARLAARHHLSTPPAPTVAAGRLSTRLRSVDENEEVAKLKDAAERLRLEVAALEQERDNAAEEARAAAFKAFDKARSRS